MWVFSTRYVIFSILFLKYFMETFKIPNVVGFALDNLIYQMYYNFVYY